MARTDHDFVVREARDVDIDSLTTTIPRSYAPDALLNHLFPSESPEIRQWWAAIYSKAIKLDSHHILVVEHSNIIIGLLTLHLWYPDDHASTSNGLCTLVPLTDAHTERKELEEALLGQAARRRQVMQKHPNFMIDLMAVDQGYQKRGIGKKLVGHACRIADQENAAIFLETTEAKAFYLRLDMGFASKQGDEESGVLVRACAQQALGRESADAM